PLEIYSRHEFALIQPRSVCLGRHRHAQHSLFPICGGIFSGGGNLLVRPKYATLRLFVFPGRKCEFVKKNRPQVFALERAENRFTGYLLPPRDGLFISHDEILIVDAGEMKMQYSSI